MDAEKLLRLLQESENSLDKIGEGDWTPQDVQHARLHRVSIPLVKIALSATSYKQAAEWPLFSWALRRKAGRRLQQSFVELDQALSEVALVRR